MWRRWVPTGFGFLLLVLALASRLGERSLPSFNDAVIAIQLIGFAPVAFLIMSVGLGSIIIWAIGYFIAKLDHMTDRLASGQGAIADELREQTKQQAGLAEDLRMLILQQSKAQESINAAKIEVQEHRRRIEEGGE